MGLKIAFAYDAKDDDIVEQGSNTDKYAEFDHPGTIDEIAAALEGGNDTVIKVGNTKNMVKRLLEGERFDLVFNITEGLVGRGREGQLPSILDLYEQPYVGSDPVTMGLTLDKSLAKKVISYHGVRTPKFFVADEGYELKDFKLKFPVFVKTSFEGTSKGINANSLARDMKSMQDTIAQIHEKYNQPALVEEFISGQEFTVVVIGNGKEIEALPPVHVAINKKTDLGDEFYTYDRVFTEEIEYLCPASIPKELENDLKEISVKAYKILACKDFSRMDFRVDREGRPFFLECNPLPNLGQADVFPLVAAVIGTNYSGLLLRILNCAIKRYKLKRNNLVETG